MDKRQKSYEQALKKQKVDIQRGAQLKEVELDKRQKAIDICMTEKDRQHREQITKLQAQIKRLEE